MKPLLIREVRDAVAGRLISPTPPDAPLISAVCTDSRQMAPHSLFVPIRGENFDGHRFLAEAAAGGAACALVDHPIVDPPPGLVLIQVTDTRKAMGRMARIVRQQLRGKVIGVAGSNGKTSTKFLIDAALRGRLRGTMSPKSYNNDIGVPLAIFPAQPNHDYLVLEMGTNHPGEIRVLTEMALPDIGIITNCGVEHLEGLGNLAGVRRENATIIDGMNAKGWLIVNGDDPELLTAVKDCPAKRLTFGFKQSNDLFASDISCSDRGVEFSLNKSRRRVFVPMLGRHTACNALAAIAVGRRLGVPEEQVFQSLAEAHGPDMRLQLQQYGGITVLNDAYNANPSSMQAALETLAALPTAGRRVAVLGDMRELGEAAERLHHDLGVFAAALGKIDHLFCVGAGGQWIADGCRSGRFPADQIQQFSDSSAAAAAIPSLLRADDLVLLKASRSIQFEKVAAAIAQSPPSSQTPSRRAAS